MRNRRNQRVKYNAKAKEEMLDSKNSFGISDPTPRETVKRIIEKRGNKNET